MTHLCCGIERFRVPCLWLLFQHAFSQSASQLDSIFLEIVRSGIRSQNLLSNVPKDVTNKTTVLSNMHEPAEDAVTTFSVARASSQDVALRYLVFSLARGGIAQIPLRPSTKGSQNKLWWKKTAEQLVRSVWISTDLQELTQNSPHSNKSYRNLADFFK
eukprot:gene15092-4501_t